MHAMDFRNLLRSSTGRVCPWECGTQKIERNGQCEARHKEPAKPSPRPTEAKEIAIPPTRAAQIERADRANAVGTWRQCMGPTSRCYELHPPEVARTWCVRRPTC